MPDYIWGTGRRKTAVARVRIVVGGSGQFVVNGRVVEEYFDRQTHVTAAKSPVEVVGGETGYDVFVNVRGGGQTGQAGAIRHGLSRALIKYDPSLRAALKPRGFLTRDSRMVERKKPGQPGARKRFQFSKR
jgi:small subunit ribosomal protein S9